MEISDVLLGLIRLRCLYSSVLYMKSRVFADTSRGQCFILTDRTLETLEATGHDKATHVN